MEATAKNSFPEIKLTLIAWVIKDMEGEMELVRMYIYKVVSKTGKSVAETNKTV